MKLNANNRVALSIPAVDQTRKLLNGAENHADSHQHGEERWMGTNMSAIIIYQIAQLNYVTCLWLSYVYAIEESLWLLVRPGSLTLCCKLPG